jgi:hypothetical protein
MESIYKSNQNVKLNGLGAKAKRSSKKCRDAQALLRETSLIRVKNVL